MTDNFKSFIKSMNDMLHSEEFLGDINGRSQGDLLNALFAAEDEFKTSLLSHKTCQVLYSDFMEYIRKEKGTILSARVYFRERQDDMAVIIHDAFEKNDPKLLYSMRINFLFAKYIINKVNKRTKLYTTLDKSFQEILKLRDILCNQNLPLAINRAKIIFSKSMSYHLEYIDLIQEASEGLLTAIDKFVPPYKTVFRSVAIGRMTLNLINANNQTMVKLLAQDRRILYRANNAANKEKLTTEKDIVNYVKKSFKDVTPEKLNNIMVAASKPTSIDTNVNTIKGDDEIKNSLTETETVEDKLIKSDLIRTIKETIDAKLTILENKVLALKCGDFEWV